MFKLNHAKILVEEIDNMINNRIVIKNEISLLPPNEYIVPKMY
jgi:hypothetical protein